MRNIRKRCRGKIRALVLNPPNKHGLFAIQRNGHDFLVIQVVIVIPVQIVKPLRPIIKFKKDAFCLPVTPEGEPDFDYMERYIRDIEKLTIEDVVKHKDKVIAATKMLVNKKSWDFKPSFSYR